MNNNNNNNTNNDILIFTKYAIEKYKNIKPTSREGLLEFIRKLFFEQEVEFEKNVIYYSGFDGDHGEEVPIIHAVSNLKMSDKLKVCDAIICNTTEDFNNNSATIYKEFSKKYPSSRCSNAWQGDHMAYRCRTCGLSDSSCMCVECFDPAEHEGHDFRLYSSPSGGCCDCGDPLAWKPSGFCKRHQVPDDYHDPSTLLDDSTRLRIEAVVYTALQYILIQANDDVHPKKLTAESFDAYAEYLKSNEYCQFEENYITITLWLKKIADCCDALRHIVNEFYLGVRIPCCEIKEVVNSFSLNTDEYLEKFKLPPVKLFFQISRKMREEPQTQFAMLHLSLLFSSKFKEKYTSHFCSEYAEYILLLAASPEDSIGKGVSGFLDRVFCQLFHSADQVLKLTKTSNLISSLVNIFTRILKECATLSVRPETLVTTHKDAGIASRCIDAEASILSQDKHCRSRILVDLKTLIGHTIVSEVLVLGLTNNNAEKSGTQSGDDSSAGLDLYKSILHMLSLTQGMNGQRREISVHVPYENKGYKIAFLTELELIQVSFYIASIVQNVPHHANDALRNNNNDQTVDQILNVTKDYLLDWLDSNYFSLEHAVTYFNRPCPNILSFHYPLHRTFALVLNSYIRREGIINNAKFSADALLNVLFDRQAESHGVTESKNEEESIGEGIDSDMVESEILRMIEHPLLVFVFTYQIYSQKWARNGRTMHIQLLYLRNHFWHDYTVQMDFFLLQFAAAVCNGENLINMLMSRFEVVCGVGNRDSPFLSLHSNLFAPGTSTYSPNVWCNVNFRRYFPQLSGMSVDQLLPTIPVLLKQSQWAMPMGEYLLMFIGQLANDRTCIGENKIETLRRALIHWLAVQDMTYSQLEDKITNSLYSKSASASEIGDSKVFQSTLEKVSTYRAPVGNAAGKYTLKDECWREIDLYFLHWTKQDQVKAVTNYNSFYEYKVKQDTTFFKTNEKFPESPFYPPLQPIKNKYIYPSLKEMPRKILLNPLLHEIIFGVLFNTLIRSKSRSSGSLFAYAVNLIILGIEVDNKWEDEMVQINEPAVSNGFPYSSSSLLVNFITKMPIKPNNNYEESGCNNQLVGNVSMLEMVAFLKDSNDMETSHASLQHIINIVSAQIPVAKVEFARCAGISVEQVGKELEEGESQADNEKAKLQEENDLRQQQIMEDFKRRQEAFFLEESSEDSSSDSDSSDEDEDDSAEDDNENAKATDVKIVVDSAKINNNRSRSKSSEEELCALCHESVCNISKHGYPGMLGFVSSNNSLDHLIKQEQIVSSTNAKNVKGSHSNKGEDDACKKFGQLWEETRGESYDSSAMINNDANIQILGCGHKLHLNCYVDYVDSLAERQKSNQRFEGFNRVNAHMGEFLCPTCRRICNIIIPVATVSHKRQHLEKDNDSDGNNGNNKTENSSKKGEEINYIPNSLDGTLANMARGLRDHSSSGTENRNNNQTDNGREENLGLFEGKLKDMNQAILSYNDEDRFLYLYSTYLRRVSNLNLSEVERWSIDFPRWCLLQLKKQLVVNNDYIQRQKMEKDIREINNAEKRNMEIEAFHSLPAIDFDWIARVARGDVTNARALPMSSSSYDAFLAKSTQSFNSFLRFLATRICDKVQLTELGQRKGNPAFCSFSSISIMEGKTILTYCGSLLRVAGLPHLQEACTGMKKRVNKYIFKNSIDSLLLFDGNKYEPILQCQNPFKVFCHSIIANNISSNSDKLQEICRVHFLANYLSCRLRALYTIVSVAILKGESHDNKDSLVQMIKTNLESLCNVFKNEINKSNGNSTSNIENMGFLQLTKVPLQDKSKIFNAFHLNSIKTTFLNKNIASVADVNQFFDRMLSELLLHFQNGESKLEDFESLFQTNGIIDRRLRSVDIHLVNSFTYDQLTQYYCLPFLRQMYIFRYYVLDNNGDYGNLKKVDGIENLTLEGEYTLHLQSMGLPSLLGGYDNHDVNSGLSMLELQLCTVWMDQLKSTVGYNVIDSTYPLSIVPKHPLLLPMQLIKLPPLYTNLYMKYYFNKVKCFACGKVPESPALCLMCGDLVCCSSICVNRHEVKDYRGQLLTGGCSIHAAECGRGTCAFLLLKQCQSLICLKGERSCIYSALYLDEHGEEDRDLKRGVLLKLEQNRLEELRKMIAKSSFEHESRVLSQTYLNRFRRNPQF